MGTENEESCSQRDSAERKGYVRAHRSFNRIWKERDSAEPDILSKILEKDNLNRAYKRVKANKGAPGIDGMTVEAALPWLREHNRELVERIRRGRYTPSPVRRVEIPKLDGGVRKLGIPTVIDRIIQQAMTQQLTPIYEPVFSEDSFGYRPGRGAKDAIQRIKKYIGQGYTKAVVLDLSKYFDTLNHTILLNLLRREIKDERVIQMVKRYLKSGVMENGVVTETEEGSLQLQIRQPFHQVAVFAPIRKIRIYQIRIRILQRFAFEFCIGTGIDFSGFDITVSEKVTDVYQIYPSLKQMDCLGMPEHMASYFFRYLV